MWKDVQFMLSIKENISDIYIITYMRNNMFIMYDIVYVYNI